MMSLLNPMELLIRLPAILLAITVHEFAHGWTAMRLGDPTARESGRLTLNPIKHLDPMGFILLLLAGFGWARPVPINPLYFSSPLRGMMAASAAGPLANLATAVLCGLIFRLTEPAGGAVNSLLVTGVFSNVVLALFNLLPFHPLDGSHVLKGCCPTGWPWRFPDTIER